MTPQDIEDPTTDAEPPAEAKAEQATELEPAAGADSSIFEVESSILEVNPPISEVAGEESSIFEAEPPADGTALPAGAESAELPVGDQPSTAAAVTSVDAPLPADAEPPADAGPPVSGESQVGGEPGGDGALPLDVATPDEGTESELPPLADDAELESALEALLLVVDTPVEADTLASALDASPSRVGEALHRLAERYTEQHRGFDLRQAGGGWRFYTRDRHAPYVERLLLDGQRAKLTRAALETLAVIAYRQPVTRARVAAVRGVNCDGVIRTLLARGLVEETGTDLETGGFLYRTTELFLERLGLSSLDDLPPIAPLLPEVDAIDDI